MTKINCYFHRIQVLTLSYFRENWGFPFVAGFLFLLFSSAILLAANMASYAEQLATVAYFTLAIGVVLQIVCFSKNREKIGDVLNGSS
jgi:hypothetical protein